MARSTTYNGIQGQIPTETVRLWYTNKTLGGSTVLSGTNYLTNGYFVCLDPVNTMQDGTSRGQCCTKPETRNLMLPAGVVTNVPANFQGPGWIEVITKSVGDISAYVKADLTGAATTSVILGPANNDWALNAISNMSADATGNVTARRSAAVATSNGSDSSGTAANQNVTILPTCAI